MAIAFAVTGKFVVCAFAMLLLVFITDFAKMAPAYLLNILTFVRMIV